MPVVFREKLSFKYTLMVRTSWGQHSGHSCKCSLDPPEGVGWKGPWSLANTLLPPSPSSLLTQSSSAPLQKLSLWSPGSQPGDSWLCSINGPWLELPTALCPCPLPASSAAPSAMPPPLVSVDERHVALGSLLRRLWGGRDLLLLLYLPQ